MDKKLFVVGLSAAVLIGLVAMGVLLFSRAGEFRGTTYGEPYPVAADFELTRFDGSLFRLGDLRGRIVLLFFGYTSCPDVCPTTLAELNQALKELGAARAEDVQVVFVTVDPGRDDPVRVQEYVNHFNPDFIGLSGTEPKLAAVWNAYGIFREIVNSVDHTARVTLIDRQGNMRVSFGVDTPVEDIVHDLHLVLKED
jgi:protein SCO1/2